MRRAIARVAVAFTPLMLLAMLAPATVFADAEVVASTVENGFPRTLTFKLEATAASEITDVTLSFAVRGRNTSAIGKPMELKRGTSVSTSVVVDVNSGSAYIPVGSDFVYHWEITTADGTTSRSADQSFLFLPTGHEWQSISNEFMVVHYYGNRQAVANTYLRAGEETYQRIGRDLFNTTLKQLPVRVVLFAVESELEQAKQGSGGRFDAAVVTCGTKVTNDIVLVIPQACGSSDRTDTLRHEFGHILNEAAGEGPLGKLPSWLDEGTAVYAQADPGADYVDVFEAAARANRLLPFAQMGTASSDASTVNLFYGQSYAMVKHLIDKAGPAKFAQFFATIKGGTRFDQALKDTYGFDLTGFEREFLAAAGSAPRAAPTAAPTQRPRQAAPTVAPTPRPQQRAANQSDDDAGLNLVVVGAIGLAVLFALAAVMFFLVSRMMSANRGRSAAAVTSPIESNRPPPE
ncbi:MAG: peptidase MA family metallohydrolase [Tepidiformaceae bacterium]